MKKTLCALSCVALSLTSVYAGSMEDYVEKNILKGNAAPIKALAKSGYTFYENDIKNFVALAAQRVTEKKAAVDDYGIKHLSRLEVGSALAGAGMSLFGAIRLYNTYKAWGSADAEEKKNWKGGADFLFNVSYAISGFMTLLKTIEKRDKKFDAAEKAEKTLRAVQSLPVAS